MKIVTLGDTHTHHWDVEVPEGDVLLFAGDGEFRSAEDLIDFNSWLTTFKHDEIIVIAGNHDFYCEQHPEETRKYLTNAVYLSNEAYVLPNGLSIWGAPMTEIFQDWAFMATDEDLERYYWSKIPRRTDILLVHSPAYGHVDDKPGFGHIGNKSLARKIDELAIPYVVNGHIHGAYGMETAEKTTYINCSVVDEDYKLANDPVIIDVQAGKKPVIK